MTSPHAKVDLIRIKHGDRFIRLLREARTLINLPRNLDHRANRMVAITDDLASTIAPFSVCKKGCSHCCYQSVVLSSWEADRIAKFTKRKIADFAGYKPHSDGRAKLINQYTGVRCPFLKDDVCNIYSVRPFACRAYFSMADESELCDIIKHPGAIVPYFNFENLHLLIGYLFVGDDCKYGDIREFFPMDEQNGR